LHVGADIIRVPGIYSTLHGPLLAGENTGADFGCSFCVGEYHGKFLLPFVLADFKGRAELPRAALLAKVLMVTASNQPLSRYCRDCA
jgi:hypothetical protein